MNWNEFTSIPNGTQVLNHGWDQCVALANLYNEDVVGGEFVPVPSAYMWFTSYYYLPQVYQTYARTGIAEPGAIFVARGGMYNTLDGHIGVVVSVNPDGSFNTMEQNAGTWRYVGRYTRDYTNVLGFLVPFINPATPPKPAPVQERKDSQMFFTYFKDAAGAGKGRWAVFGTNFWLEIETQESANQFAKQLGFSAFSTGKSGWDKFKRVSGG